MDIDRLTDEMVAGAKGMMDRQLAPIRAALDEQIKANEQLAADNHELRQQLTALAKRLDEQPEPEPGQDGADGKDGSPGEKGDPGEQGQPGERGQDGMDGRDGTDGKDGAPGRDGVGIADALINREGELVLTFTDGSVKNVGQVVGRDGQDGTPGEKGEDGAPGEPGEDGADGRDGQDGADGVDGKDASPEQIKAAVAEALPGLIDKAQGELTQRLEQAIAEIPEPKDGIDGKDGEPGQDGADGRDGLDGKDASPEQIKAAVAEALPGLIDKARGELTQRLEQAIAEIPEPKDGIDGKDGEPGQDGADGRDGLNGKDGQDGLGFDDLRLEYDGERTLKLIFQRGEQVSEHALHIPALIDRGVWKAGEFEAGDVVSQGGSLWIARRATQARPGENDDWRLSVKRGRDGKPGKPGGEGEE